MCGNYVFCFAGAASAAFARTLGGGRGRLRGRGDWQDLPSKFGKEELAPFVLVLGVPVSSASSTGEKKGRKGWKSVAPYILENGMAQKR